MSRKLRHQAEYLGARLLERIFGTLPERLAGGVGAAMGSIAHGLGVRRDVVERNLGRAFPDLDDAARREIGRSAYRHLGREASALLRLSRMPRRAIVDRTEVVGWDEFRAAHAEGRGVVVVTGHLGNWELSAAAVGARGLPVLAVAKQQSNPLVDRRLEGIRRGLGIETVDMTKAPRRIPRALRAGQVVGFVADQDAGSTGLFLDFFGVPASTHRGPAVFGLRFGSPVFFATCTRLPGWRARYRLSLLPVQAVDSAGGDHDTAVRDLTQRLTEHLEAAIRRDADQYFWMHNRWKRRPSGELAAGEVRTTAGRDVPTSMNQKR